MDFSNILHESKILILVTYIFCLFVFVIFWGVSILLFEVLNKDKIQPSKLEGLSGFMNHAAPHVATRGALRGTVPNGRFL